MRIGANKLKELQSNKKVLILIIAANCLIAITTLFLLGGDKADAFDQIEIEGEISHKVLAQNESKSYNYSPSSELPALNEALIENAKARESQQAQIDHLYSFLYRQNPGVFSRSIVSIIVQESNRYGADYRIVAAIMGKESGYCNANYKLYNCFGFLNGVQYGSFEEAFRNLTPQIARIVARHGWNTMGIANEYRPVDRKGWADKVYKMASEI